MQDSVKGLSRKEKLAKWRAMKASRGDGSGKAAPAANSFGQTRPRTALAVLKSNSTNSARPALRRHGNGLLKKPALNKNNGALQRRKPFQVDDQKVKLAGARRVGPGTPIHTLKRRLRQAKATAAGGKLNVPAKALVHSKDTFGATKQVAGVGAVVKKSGAEGGLAASLAQSMELARMKEISVFLKSQISEANMLLEVSCVDEARELMTGLLKLNRSKEKRVGELALYWAARSKIEEDIGEYNVARSILDEGQAYLTIPTQQRVLSKVYAAFERRIDKYAEMEVDKLFGNKAMDMLCDSTTSSGCNNSLASTDSSPLSNAPYRYDPNELNLDGDDDNDSESVSSAIKNLNFSRAAIALPEEDGSGGAVAALDKSRTSSTGSNNLL
ncbi:unnamed protein product, partial [Choristocarpus tenellus]